MLWARILLGVKLDFVEDTKKVSNSHTGTTINHSSDFFIGRRIMSDKKVWNRSGTLLIPIVGNRKAFLDQPEPGLLCKYLQQ